MKMDLVFDASALITAAQFEVGQQPLLDHILSHCQIFIPEIVGMEVIDNGLQGGYADAILLDQRVKSGEIRIIPTKPKANVFQSVLDDYGIEAGDKDLLWLCRQMKDYEFVVVDDRLLYIVLNRFQMQPRFLPDVLVWFAQRGSWSVEFTRQALNAVRPRYRRGFITHSLALMEGNL